MTDTKPTNPKDAVGASKVPMSTLPVAVLMEAAAAMLEGALKYGRHNYRVAGIRHSIYYDAVWRHLGAFWEGEDIDLKSGICHLSKAIAGLIVWRDAMLNGKVTDDRPPRGEQGFVERLNDVCARMIESVPNPLMPCTEVPLTPEVVPVDPPKVVEPERPLPEVREPLPEVREPLTGRAVTIRWNSPSLKWGKIVDPLTQQELSTLLSAREIYMVRCDPAYNFEFLA